MSSFTISLCTSFGFASSSIRVLCIALVDGFFDYRAIRSADHDRLITYLSEPDHVADLHGGAVQIKCGSRACQS